MTSPFDANAAREHRVYTVWAGLKDDPESVWMIWACDEYSYDGMENEREAELAEAKKRAGDDVEFREVTIKVGYAEIQARFLEGVVEGELADV